MKLPRPRSTVRWLMAAVAVAALACDLEAWRRTAPSCRRKAARCVSAGRAHLWMALRHEELAALLRRHAAAHGGDDRFDLEQAASFARSARDERSRARRAMGRAGAFRWAATYPWAPLPPEPDEPGEFGGRAGEERLARAYLEEAGGPARAGPRSRGGRGPSGD
jgi:hypothetical protein